MPPVRWETTAYLSRDVGIKANILSSWLGSSLEAEVGLRVFSLEFGAGPGALARGPWPGGLGPVAAVRAVTQRPGPWSRLWTGPPLTRPTVFPAARVFEAGRCSPTRKDDSVI